MDQNPSSQSQSQSASSTSNTNNYPSTQRQSVQQYHQQQQYQQQHQQHQLGSNSANNNTQLLQRLPSPSQLHALTSPSNILPPISASISISTSPGVLLPSSSSSSSSLLPASNSRFGPSAPSLTPTSSGYAHIQPAPPSSSASSSSSSYQLPPLPLPNQNPEWSPVQRTSNLRDEAHPSSLRDHREKEYQQYQHLQQREQLAQHQAQREQREQAQREQQREREYREYQQQQREREYHQQQQQQVQQQQVKREVAMSKEASSSSGGGNSGGGGHGEDPMPSTSDFVKKLYKMLEDPTFQSVVSWGPQGDCFVVKDMNEFTKSILPRMFKHSNFASFVRQLNKYDFHKVKNTDDNQFGEHSWTFRHPDFHADRRDALENIKRKVPAQRKSSAVTPTSLSISTSSLAPSIAQLSPTSLANLSSLTNLSSLSNLNNLNSNLNSLNNNAGLVDQLQLEVRRLKEEGEDLRGRLRNLERNYESVLVEMVGFQRGMAQQDGLMQSLITYFLGSESDWHGYSSIATSVASSLLLALFWWSRRIILPARWPTWIGFALGSRPFSFLFSFFPGSSGSGRPCARVLAACCSYFTGDGGDDAVLVDLMPGIRAHQQFHGKLKSTNGPATQTPGASGSHSQPPSSASVQQQAPLSTTSDHNPFLPMHAASRIMGGRNYPEADVGRATLMQMSELSRRAAEGAAGSGLNLGAFAAGDAPGNGSGRTWAGLSAAAAGGNGFFGAGSSNGAGDMGAPPPKMSRADALAKIEELHRERLEQGGWAAAPVASRARNASQSRQGQQQPTPSTDGDGDFTMPSSASTPAPSAQPSWENEDSPSSVMTHEGLQVYTVGHLMPRSNIDDGNGGWSFDPSGLGMLTGADGGDGQRGYDPSYSRQQQPSGAGVDEEIVQPSPGSSPPTAPAAPSSQKLRVRRSTFVPGWAVPPRVLLVDDDAVSRKLSSKFLQVFGCTTDVAVDGVGAVNKMNLEKYDLVLMDIVMPKLDGVSATSLIRKFDHMTPIISMTSNSKPNEIMTYYSSGMNDILPKPFTKEGLLDMLEKHLMHLKVIQQMGRVPRPLGVPPLNDAGFEQAITSGAAASGALIPQAMQSTNNSYGITDGMENEGGRINPLAGMGLTDEQYNQILQNIVNGESFMGGMGLEGMGTNISGSEKRPLDDPSDGRDSKRSRFEVIE
ncbi:hypothetical protein BDQ12DRAFT_669888 [Crucibulum laeve]|uniref:Response regulatory domain-containing protein n=1 Tax=Crucibulum laeve TaxID=68775 RepID=A0A5C3LNF1_9AGAR|nr:hypothetical protein BDQ12DRAFT_669888 [Crucibulum laeve]